ncbi:hypothetical protein AKO1_014141 [Acrasis kona]|uniref:Uncharacterized protein n=1 Tax=Acrasis kona TaxID=1008807 RepID=A0AAW2Z1P3_9EUKA
MINRSLTTIINDSDVHAHNQLIDNYHNSGQRHMLGNPRPLLGKTKDGVILNLTVVLGELVAHTHNSKSLNLVYLFRDSHQVDDYFDDQVPEENEDQLSSYGYSNEEFTRSQYMRCFVRIPGMQTVVLKQLNGLEIHHYKRIVEKWYSELYKGNPPSPLFIFKIINFKNGDKWMEFKRKQTQSILFSCEAQENINIYNEPDACKDSILLEKSPNPEIFNGQVPKLIGLNRLILLLTDPHTDRYLMKVMWWTYRNFTKPKVLLLKLIERFNVPNLDSDLRFYHPLERAYFDGELKRAIQLRVIEVLEEWVTYYFFDFDDLMVKTLRTFCEKLPRLGLGYTMKDILYKIDHNSREPVYKFAKQSMLDSFGLSRRNSAASIAATPSNVLLNESAKDIAEQLTLIDFELYNQIHFTEMLGQSWNKDKKRHMAPNIMNSINFLNRVSNWIAHNILKEKEIRNRASIIRKAIHILKFLVEMHSYNMMTAVNAALGNAGVFRLTQTWELVEESLKNDITKIKDGISSPKGNSRNFREAMRKAYIQGLNCSPFVAIYFRDLVFLDDGNPNIIEDKINFLKCINIYNTMATITRFQGRNYSFTRNSNIIKDILYHHEVSDDDLYNYSLNIQPKKSTQ